MNELIRLILSLPVLDLSQPDWADLSYLLNNGNLEEKNIVTLGKAIDSSQDTPVLRSKKSDIIKFMTVWFTIADKTISWLNQLSRLYQEEIHKPLSADDSLPLIVELLPNDKEKMTLLLEKLTLASNIDDHGPQGYSLITLYSSFSAKLTTLTDEKQEEYPEEKEVAERIKSRDKINWILPSCQILKKSLADKFLERFKVEAPERYQLLAKNDDERAPPLSEEEIITRIVKENNISSLTFTNPECTLYFNKYLIVTDITHTLLRKNDTSTHILEEFAAKYHLHETALNQTLDPAVKQFFKSTRQYSGVRLFFDLIGKSRKDVFTEKAEQLITQQELANQNDSPPSQNEKFSH